MNFNPILLRINNIAGMYYSHPEKNVTLVIYGLGAPVVPDNGTLPDAAAVMQYKTDLFVPDYIGFGRSDGRFTPKNCINTFLRLFEYFSAGAVAVNNYARIRQVLKYRRIIFIGRSLGGTYLPLLPRFNPEIKELGLLYPAIDNPSCGSIPGEESNQDFLRAMQKDGYHYLYRGILDESWGKHLSGGDDLLPADNLKYLKNTRLFIGHGKKDRCIHYSKSVIYFDKLIRTFPDKKSCFRISLYDEGGHDVTTSLPAVNDFLEWLELKKY